MISPEMLFLTICAVYCLGSFISSVCIYAYEEYSGDTIGASDTQFAIGLWPLALIYIIGSLISKTLGLLSRFIARKIALFFMRIKRGRT